MDAPRAETEGGGDIELAQVAPQAPAERQTITWSRYQCITPWQHWKYNLEACLCSLANDMGSIWISSPDWF